MADKKAIQKAIDELSGTKKAVRFGRLMTICETFFGSPRTAGSHHIYRTPWKGDPRINIQKEKGSKNAKAYQVSQVVDALEKLKNESE